MLYQEGSPSLFRNGVDPAAPPVLVILGASHLASLVPIFLSLKHLRMFNF